MPLYINAAREMGVKVLVPDVNESGEEYVADDGNIRIGLSNVKNVGVSGKAIVDERKKNGKFVSLKDFCKRCNVGKGSIEALAFSGTFDRWTKNRGAIPSYFEDVNLYLKKIEKKQKRICEYGEIINATKDEKKKLSTEKALKKAQNEIDNYNYLLEELRLLDITKTRKELFALERELLGTYISGSPIDDYDLKEISEVRTQSIGDISDISRNTVLVGVVSDVEIKRRKKDGAEFLTFRLDDETGNIECTVFTKNMESLRDVIEESEVVALRGRINTDNFDEENLIYKFSAESVAVKLEPKCNVIMLVVKNVVDFCEMYEEVKKYTADNNSEKCYRLQVYDEAMAEIRDTSLYVTEDILKNFNATICNV